MPRMWKMPFLKINLLFLICSFSPACLRRRSCPMFHHMPYFILVIASPQEARQCLRPRTLQVSCSGTASARAVQIHFSFFLVRTASSPVTLQLPSPKSGNKTKRKFVSVLFFICFPSWEMWQPRSENLLFGDFMVSSFFKMGKFTWAEALSEWVVSNLLTAVLSWWWYLPDTAVEPVSSLTLHYAACNGFPSFWKSKLCCSSNNKNLAFFGAKSMNCIGLSDLNLWLKLTRCFASRKD